MGQTRFVMLGGFLGAGKTTAIARLARMFQQRGVKVGIVTNDQAADLVDTHSLRAQGFHVGEVAGACFCCHFNELTATLDRLESAQAPDVLLCEPVGSCTDLVATVVRPMRRLFDRRFVIAPYGVLLKPSHGRRILSGQHNAGFSPKAEYIFNKQIEEADFLLLNRIDELAPDEVEEITRLLDVNYPGRKVMKVSAKTGEGFESLYDFLMTNGMFGRRIIDVDYDIYADGEAELGWLNCSVHVQGPKSFALDALLLEIVNRLRTQLNEESAETAHLKVIGEHASSFGVANLVNSWRSAELSVPSNTQVDQAEIIVNARVAIDPARLHAIVNSAVVEAAASVGATATIGQTNSFRPGRPVPTHRIN